MGVIVAIGVELGAGAVLPNVVNCPNTFQEPFILIILNDITSIEVALPSGIEPPNHIIDTAPSSSEFI